MYKMIRVLIIATPLLAITACAANGAGSAADDQEADPGAAVQAADTQTVGWTDATVDPTEVIPDVTCIRLVSFNDSSCPAGFVCLWQNADRSGFGVAESSRDGCRIHSMLSVKCEINGIQFSCPHGHGTFNDEMSSWWNHSNRQSCWFFDVGFQGTAVPMSAQTIHNGVAPGNNDQASSLRPASEGC
jgi:hypothetical protein